MKYFKIFISLLLVLNLSCADESGPTSSGNRYIPEKPSEFSVAESVAKVGLINTPEGQENILIIYPVVGVKLKEGKIKVNQDVTVVSGSDTIDTKTDIYGPDGLTLDVLKIGGNPNLTFAGVELATEIIPPPYLTGTIVVNISVKDLNSPGSVVKFTRGFRSDKVFNPYAKPCVVNQTKTVPSPSSSPEILPSKPCSNQIIKTYTSDPKAYLSGVDKVTAEKDMESFLIGKWELSKPSQTWYSELKELQSPQLNTDNPAPTPIPPGTLTIFQNKEFIWQKADETTQGIMEQVIPRSYADPKLTYWKIYSGKNNYYLYYKSGFVYINEQDSHLYSLLGKLAS